jgi:hypothetical protein
VSRATRSAVIASSGVPLDPAQGCWRCWAVDALDAKRTCPACAAAAEREAKLQREDALFDKLWGDDTITRERPRCEGKARPGGNRP